MKQLSGPELMAALARAGGRPPLVLDVREPWEVALARIDVEGLETLHVPMDEVPARLVELDPSRPLVCVCHHGVRSAHVVAFLDRIGFEAASNLAGGIDAWSQKIDPSVPRY